MDTKERCLPEIANRNSPLFYSDKKIEQEKLDCIIEAARLAPSALNNQPWRYVFVSKDASTRKALEKSLNISNWWSKKAPYLIAVYSRERDDVKSHDIGYYIYDTALSVMSLVIEAEHQGLKARQMAAFNQSAAKKALSIPDDYTILVIIALGYEEENISKLDRAREGVEERIIRHKVRKPREEIISFDMH